MANTTTPCTTPPRRILTYDRGRWGETPDPLPGDGDFDDQMRDAGYCRTACYGEEHGTLRLEVFEHADSPAHVVVVNTWSRFHPIFVPDLPSLFLLLRELLPVVEASARLGEADERRVKRERKKRRERGEWTRIRRAAR
jgi:hypothetical protein